METERATRLAEAGFATHCDGKTRKVPADRIRLFDECELWGVEDLVDRAVFGTIARRKRAQTPREVVAVLRWEEGYELGDLVRTPWDQVGCFAHFDPSALLARLQFMLDRAWIVERRDGTLDLPSE